jgi:hypothetical protein
LKTSKEQVELDPLEEFLNKVSKSVTILKDIMSQISGENEVKCTKYLNKAIDAFSSDLHWISKEEERINHK